MASKELNPLTLSAPLIYLSSKLDLFLKIHIYKFIYAFILTLSIAMSYNTSRITFAFWARKRFSLKKTRATLLQGQFWHSKSQYKYSEPSCPSSIGVVLFCHDAKICSGLNFFFKFGNLRFFIFSSKPLFYALSKTTNDY